MAKKDLLEELVSVPLDIVSDTLDFFFGSPKESTPAERIAEALEEIARDK